MIAVVLGRILDRTEQENKHNIWPSSPQLISVTPLTTATHHPHLHQGPVEVASKPPMPVGEQACHRTVRHGGNYRYMRQGSAHFAGEAIVHAGSAGRQRL